MTRGKKIRISLTGKMLLVIVVLGCVVLAGSDQLLIRQVKASFQQQISQKVQEQVTEGRLRFDSFVKTHFQLARVIVSQHRFVDHLDTLADQPAEQAPRIHIRPPNWFPRRGVMRALAQAGYYILLDGNGRVREVYESEATSAPADLLHPEKQLINASHNENFMTSIGGIPFLVSSSSVYGAKKRLRATLMLATPMDDAMLVTLQPPYATNQIVALATGFDPLILTSSDLELVPKGERLEELKNNFLLIGEKVFNYEYADLLVSYNHLMPREEIDRLAHPVILRTRLQILIISLVFIASFAFVMTWVTRRIQRQTQEMVDFSSSALGKKPEALAHGDQLDMLEQQFRLLSEEVLAANREQAALMQTILQAIPAPIYFIDEGGKYLGCNQAFCDFIGLAQENFIGKKAADFLDSKMQLAFHQEDEDLLQRGSSGIFSKKLTDHAGRSHDFIVHKAIFHKADSSKAGLISVLVNVTDLKSTSEQLAQAHAFLESLLDSIPDLIFYKDKDSVYLGGNKSFSKLIDREVEDIIGLSDLDLFPREIAEFFREKDRQMLSSGAARRNEEWVTYPDGSKILLDTLKTPYYGPDGTILGLIGISRDITEKKKAEGEKGRLMNQLRQAQKMEAIGTLAGGIAHDFNNILTSIIGYATLVQYDLPMNSQSATRLAEVIKAGDRAKDLVNQILTFSRQSEQEQQPVEIKHIVKEAIKLLRASIPTTIEIKMLVDNNCGVVVADPTQIHQVVMNLCTNAYHAMKENGGILTVSMEPVELETSELGSEAKLPAGPYVRLEVQDTGHGIPEEIIERIFDPYYTTKPKGEGTGMGLAVVHGIIKSHGGHIKVTSAAGVGTRFQIYLPRVEHSAIDRVQQAARPDATHGTERILLVDDEEQITSLLSEMLEDLGYRVTAKTSSKEALQCFTASPNDFDLVVTDMTMPGLTGTELAHELLAVRKDLPIILCTGFSEVVDEQSAKAMGIKEYILKPVVITDLAVVIRKLFDQ